MPKPATSGRRLATQQSVNSAIWSTSDILPRSNRANALTGQAFRGEW